MKKSGKHKSGIKKGPVELAELGEFGFIARLARPFLRGMPAGVQGIGDDCAVLPWTKDQRMLVTTDMLVEDRHFVLKSTKPFDLGYKSLAVNLSDIAAMGGRPTWALISIGVPSGIGLRWLDDFFRGWRTAAKPWDVRLVGGDTTRSPGGLVINVVVIGEVPAGREKLRSAARVGDTIAVTGTLGESGGGLKILLAREGKAARGRSGETGEGAADATTGVTATRRTRAAALRVIPGGRESEGRVGAGAGAAGAGATGAGGFGKKERAASSTPSGFRILPGGKFEGGEPEVFMLSRSGSKDLLPSDRRAVRLPPDEMCLVRAHVRPRPHIEEGEWLGEQPGVRAMMDVSDGIDSDVRRIMEQSRVGADIDLARLPVSDVLRRVAKRRGFDPVETAAAGGEDYCLLVTIEKGRFDSVGARFLQRFHRPLAAIGVVRPEASGLRYFLRGRPAELRSRGYDHFK